MITSLKSGYSKIMQLFYKTKSIELHLREIARQTKLFEPSASRFLGQLEKDSILISKKEGNLKKYSIKKGAKTYYIFEAFDLDKFEKLPTIKKNAIKTFLKTLKKKPIFVVLFGSSAKGTFKENSDIDLLLITNSKIKTEESEKEVNALTAQKINPFQLCYKEFLTEIRLKEDKVVQSAINSGFPLINHIEYYEILHNERI